MSRGKYDLSVVYMMEPRSAAFDGVARQSTGLVDRIKRKLDPVIHITCRDKGDIIKAALSKCTNHSRLYLIAHGSTDYFADKKPEALAAHLISSGLQAVKRIILCGCKSGLSGKGKGSYAEEFHGFIGTMPGGVKCEVVGFYDPVSKYSLSSAKLDDLAKENEAAAKYYRDRIGKTVIHRNEGRQFLINDQHEPVDWGTKWITTWKDGKQITDFLYAMWVPLLALAAN